MKKEKHVFGRMDVLALVYADWCHHCHDFLPVFHKAVSGMQGSPKVMKIEEKQIARMAAASEADRQVLEVARGFPTLMYVRRPVDKSQGLQVIVFQRARTVADVRSFITDHSKIK